MYYCLKYVLNSVILIVLCFSTYAQQIHFLSDHFKGGVTGGGYNPGNVDLAGQIDLNIPVGSTIRKAYLFASATKHYNHTDFPEPRTIVINGQTIGVSMEDALYNNYTDVLYGSQPTYEMRTVVKDITHLNLSSIISIVPPIQIMPPFFWEYYILVLYENNSFPPVAVDVFINEQDADSLMNYPLTTSMVIDPNNAVSLALNASHFCDNIQDGSNVSVNGNLLGLIGGEDYNHIASCTGTTSGFYYENNTLFGLGDDTPTPYMSGSDALANIQNYITNTQLIDVNFVYQSNLGPRSNPINQLFLTYTTTCAPFDVSVTNDTTICQGEQLQLLASSANPNATYEWSVPAGGSSSNPAPGLSCTSCPNPVFSGDSSMFYTVRIWNNDSCSVVRPVHITVKKPPVLPQLTTLKAVCGIASGSINVQQPQESGVLYLVSENGDTLAKPLNKGQNTTRGVLCAGNYTVYFQDSLGCRSDDSSFVIPTSNNTVAGFTVSPQSGGAPLEVAINNTSAHAQNFNWYVNGALQSNPFTGFVADTSGSYQIMLVAWQNDVSCADTAYATVNVYDSLIVHVPNVFTPNGDGINDFFSITTNFEVSANVVILNRWGEVVYRFEGNLQAGENKLWNGGSVSDGVYFYKLTMKELTMDNFQLKKEGFVTVVR